jgi:hypothetical protein
MKDLARLLGLSATSCGRQRAVGAAAKTRIGASASCVERLVPR